MVGRGSGVGFGFASSMGLLEFAFDGEVLESEGHWVVRVENSHYLGEGFENMGGIPELAGIGVVALSCEFEVSVWGKVAFKNLGEKPFLWVFAFMVGLFGYLFYGVAFTFSGGFSPL